MNGIHTIHATYLYNVHLSIYAYTKSIYELFYQVLANSIYCLGEDPFGGNGDDGDRNNNCSLLYYYTIVRILYIINIGIMHATYNTAVLRNEYNIHTADNYLSAWLPNRYI